MTLLVRARSLIGRPVVTLGGDDVAEVKDVVFSTSAAKVVGFTLNPRGFFSRQLKAALPWSGVHAVGRDAVMVSDTEVFEAPDAVLAGVSASDRNVIGNRVFTDEGTELGEVTDVVVALEPQSAAEIVGYEIGGAKNLKTRAGRHLYIPLPDTLAVSGEALVVPAAATRYIRDDLSGFGSAVEEFRAALREEV